MRRTDGELILFWTLPAVAVIWIAAFFLFPGFVHPMSPTMSADEVAAFYRDETARIRYSMILFNWFGVGLIPIVMLLAMQIRRMAHRTPILSYSLIALRRRAAHALPHRQHVLAPRLLPPGTRAGTDPDVERSRVGDLHHSGALLDRPMPAAGAGDLLGPPGTTGLQTVGGTLQPARSRSRWHLPRSPRWRPPGHLAWDGLLSFWVKNIAVAVWIVVMGVVLGQTISAARTSRRRSAVAA